MFLILFLPRIPFDPAQLPYDAAMSYASITMRNMQRAVLGTLQQYDVFDVLYLARIDTKI